MDTSVLSYDEQMQNLLSYYNEKEIEYFKSIVDESDRCFPNEEASYIVTEEINNYVE